MKKDNNFIRKEADDLLRGKLRNLFLKNEMSLKEHGASAGEDNGTDFYFDVTSKNEEHNFFFRNQNKGTNEKLSIISRKSNENFNKISYKISLRNAINYFTEFDEPIIFTLCDINSEQVYWYDIQNDSSLQERIQIQKSKKIDSIMIYIPQENILNEISFGKLIEEIKFSKLNQLRKKRILNTNLQADYSLTSVNTENKHIIDQLDYTLKLFDGIKVLPINVICQLHPFKGSENKTFLREFTLGTDNEDFYNLMNSLELSGSGLHFNTEEIFVEDQQKKLENIISFFQVNHIQHIQWRGKQPKNKVCVHDLYQFGKCECERCSFDRLNIAKTYSVLKETKKNSTNYEKLRKGYTYYLLGDYEKSARVFLDVFKEASKSQNPIIYTISTYNITRLKRLIELTYYDNEREELLKEISAISFDIDEPFIKKTAPYFLDIFTSIKEGKFYDDAKDDMERCLTKIKKAYYIDKTGKEHFENSYYEFKFTFLRFRTYLEHNFIIFSHYSDYHNFSSKVLEGMLAMYSIKNPLNKNEILFDWNIIEMTIFHVKMNEIKFLLNKYDVKEIQVDKELPIAKMLNELVENLINSRSDIKNLSGVFNQRKIDVILEKIVLLTSLIDVDFSEKKNIIEKIVKLSNLVDNKRLIPLGELVDFVDKNEDEIDKHLVKSIIDLFFFDKYESYGFGRIINIFAEKSTPLEIESFVKSVLKIKSLKNIKFDFDNRYLPKLFYCFTFLNNTFKSNLKKKITDNLANDFNDDLYSYSLVYDLIDFDDDLFSKFCDTVPDMSKLKSDKFSLDYENIRLGQVINFAFKYKVELSNIRILISKSHEEYYEYYTWLMDIDNFDYSKFNPFWVLEFQTTYYFERFKKSDKLKDELIKSLKNNYVEGIAKFYFEELAK